jgi:hypothetical protein
MNDGGILLEIEGRIREWFKEPGWAEENAGFRQVSEWIEELRAKKATPRTKQHP